MLTAQLSVTVSPPKATGQKVVVPIAIKNDLLEKVESARAVLFLSDGQGKVVGQSAKWVIGGRQGSPGLAVGATNIFYFVVTSPLPLTSTNNLQSRIVFDRIVLESGKYADPRKDVQIVVDSNRP